MSPRTNEFSNTSGSLEIARLQALVERLRSEQRQEFNRVAQLRADLSAAVSTRIDAEREAEALRAEAAGLREQWRHAQAQFEAERRRRFASMNELTSLQEHAAAVEHDRQRLAVELEGVGRSRVWRWSQPLRLVRRVVRYARKRSSAA